MKFYKYHALGNDYLVLNPGESAIPCTEEIQRICHRNHGLGSDGILFGPLYSEKGDFGLRILNPDGSEAEKSGNGLRIFSQYLFDTNQVQYDPFTVDTPGGLVVCKVLEPFRRIEVEMGNVLFTSNDIPVTGTSREVLNEEIIINERPYRFYAVTIGNPHAVFPMENPTREIACEIGPVVENMRSMFPNRINVQCMEILNRNKIHIEIWERGAGYTWASGSSSCAAAAVAYKMGACDDSITVQNPGGDILVQIGNDYTITMTGPVARVESWIVGL